MYTHANINQGSITDSRSEINHTEELPLKNDIFSLVSQPYESEDITRLNSHSLDSKTNNRGTNHGDKTPISEMENVSTVSFHTPTNSHAPIDTPLENFSLIYHENVKAENFFNSDISSCLTNLNISNNCDRNALSANSSPPTNGNICASIQPYLKEILNTFLKIESPYDIQVQYVVSRLCSITCEEDYK